MTTPQWWQARLDGSRKTGRQFDVTCTWTNEQRAQDTGIIAAALKPLLAGAKRVVDFGAGRGRFATVIKQDWRAEYVGIEILPDLVAEIRSRGLECVLYDGKPIPPEVDGDTAIFCLVLQHLSDEKAIEALRATKARQIAIVHGAWHGDGYTTCRDQVQLTELVKKSRDGWAHIGFHVLTAPLAKYKILVAKYGNAS